MIKSYIHKEISWLSFNARLLQEAQNSEVPLLERIQFLGIYSNNLDEFFRVRVATLKRLTKLGNKAKELLGDDPRKIHREVNEIVLRQQLEFEKAFALIQTDLVKENIFIVNEKQLRDEHKQFVEDYFHREVRPKLIPVMLGQSEIFPDIKDDEIYLAVYLKKNDQKKVKYALIQIPTKVLPRFLILPSLNKSKYIILLDDVIRYGLKDIFYIFEFDEISAYTIKLTKDAELDIDDDWTESYVKKITRGLKLREEGLPVRFVYDDEIPHPLLNFIMKSLMISKADAIIPGGTYHNFKDFMNFPNIGGSHLRYEPLPSLPNKDLKFHTAILDAVKKKDILLHFPYHSFDNFIDLLREAAIDPKVISIKITLYRLAKNSSVINALINAMKNGKAVTAVVELQARFDEEANIIWSNTLKDEGAKVIYGARDLKVHSKLCLITRKEKNSTVDYACIGTGNFNEDTTRIFSDHMLITADRRLTNEVVKLFDFFDKHYQLKTFRHLLVSPFYMRNRIEKMINNEINNALNGKKAYIIMKLNNLVDEAIIAKLYEANRAGVKLMLNVRGMFSLMSKQSKNHRNIEAIGIIDRFLEHSRIIVFCNGGDELYFISSADLMPRNLDRRVEVCCPIYDKSIQRQLRQFLDIQWQDNVKARILNNKQTNRYKKTQSANPIRSQYEIYKYIKSLNNT